MSSEVCPSSEARIHEVSSSVSSYPVQRMRYNSLQVRRRLSILESSISEISKTGSSSTAIGRGGGWMQSGIGFGVAGSSMEMWNTGCTAWRLSRSRSVMEWVPGHARISYGPRNFSVSFLEGHVVRKNCALMYAWLPIFNSGAGSHLESAGTRYGC